MRSGIGATYQKTLEKQETQKRGKYYLFGVFFDGTGNDMTNNHLNDKAEKSSVASSNSPQLSTAKQYKVFNQPSGSIDLEAEYANSDEVDANDYSNIALLQSCFQGMSSAESDSLKSKNDVHIYNIYSEGPGTTGSNPLIGSGYGIGESGVISLLSKVAAEIEGKLIGDLSNVELHFCVFGFSRGAAIARMFSTMVLEEELPSGIDSWLTTSEYKKKIKSFKETLKKIPAKSIHVDFIGLFDTVSSIGTGTNDVDDYGLYLNDNVKAALQLCASDEFREHFALTDLGQAVEKPNIAEFFIPGCHTDVGGTYKSAIRLMEIQYRYLMKIRTKEGTESKMVPYKMFVSNPHSRNGQTRDISKKTLSMLGWYSEDKDEWEEETFKYSIRRFVKQGYNLIPFNLMLGRANEVSGNKLFIEIPKNVSRFTVPAELEPFSKWITDKVESQKNNRHFLYSSKKSDAYLYKNLRANYINYSSKLSVQVMDKEPGKFAHDISRQNDTICRQIVPGDKGSKGVKWMSDYVL